jgi:hypothetical protein
MLGIELSLIEVFVNMSQSIGPFELVDARYNTKGVGVSGWSRELWGHLVHSHHHTLFFSFQNTTYMNSSTLTFPSRIRKKEVKLVVSCSLCSSCRLVEVPPVYSVM